MKFEFPPLTTLLKITIVALLLSGVIYFLSRDMETSTVSASRLLAYGSLAGALLGGLFSHLNFTQFIRFQRQASLFVGNLAFKTSPGELRSLFEKYGTVHNVRLMTDRATRRPKGFGFVEMDSKGAKAALANLDGIEFHGRELKINMAHQRK